MSIPVDALVAKYVELRDRRAAIKKVYSLEDKELIKLMDKIELKLQGTLNDMGVNSFNTDHGTVMTVYRETAKVADWDTLLKHILETEDFSLLERRVSKTQVKEIMEENRDGSYRNPPPPGVDFSRLATVQVRRKS